MAEQSNVVLGRVMIAVSVVLGLLWVGTQLDASVFQHRMGERLDALSVIRPHSDGEAARAESKLTGLVGRIEIESADLSAIVIEGTQGKALRRGVGHVTGTAYPGEPGNVALAGHRDTFFRGLEKVAVGDSVTLSTPDGRFEYVVDSVLVVGPERVDLLEVGHEPRLTLVTCYPFDYVGPAPQRYVVLARART